MSVIKTYDLARYDWRPPLENIFNINRGELNRLHDHRSDLLPVAALNFENETRTDFHKVFYGILNSPAGEPLKLIYNNFIKEAIAPLFPDDFLYQKFPSFRVHLPNDQAVHKWHYDSDADHCHPDWEINFQIALTKMFDSNAMWLESVPNLGDFHPIEMDVGEFCIFYGNKCKHGNKRNDTGLTRVSMDFRILPLHKHDPEKALSSVTKDNKFVAGGYYDLYSHV